MNPYWEREAEVAMGETYAERCKRMESDLRKVRGILVDADSVLSLIYNRAGRVIESRFGEEFKERVGTLYWTCRKMVDALSEPCPTCGGTGDGEKDNTAFCQTCYGGRFVLKGYGKMLTELPAACGIGDHVPVIVHRSGGLSAELHNTCGKCGRMILNLAGTWILDVYREEETSK